MEEEGESGDDAFAAGATEGEPGVAFVEDDGGRDGGPGKGVGAEVEGVLGQVVVEVVEVVVVEESKPFGDGLAAIDALDGLGEADSHTGFVDDGEV